MSVPRITLAVSILFLSTGYAQTSRTFHLNSVPNPAALQEIGTIIRTVGAIKTIDVDVAKFDITVTGSDADLSFAAWLVKQLDTSTPDAAAGSYTAPDGKDGIRIYYLAHAPQQFLLNEMVTTVRLVADVQRIFTYSPARAVVLRSGLARLPLTDWLVQQLDVAPDDQARWKPRQIPAADLPGEVVKVMYLIHPLSNAGLVNIVTSLRAIVGVQRLFTHSSPQGIALRGTPGQVQFADWLFQQLDVQPDDRMRAQKHEYLLRDDNQSVSRVYYLTSGATPEYMNELATTIRTEASVQRIFTSPQIAALSLRGTPEAVDSADKIISAGQR